MKPSPNGLRPIAHDRSKDYSHVKKFGGVSVSDLPLSLGRTRRVVEDQAETDFCTAYQISKAISYMRNIDMSPEWQVGKEGEYIGTPILDGADPKQAMNAARANGALPKALSPYTLQDKGADFIADWSNYDPKLDKIANPYAPVSWFAVGNGTGDVFDNIRGALFTARAENAPVLSDGTWYQEWNQAADSKTLKGKVPVPTNPHISLHAYLFIDWVTENGVPYLVGHLSQGPNWGDQGFLYFSRECVNKAFQNTLGNGTGLYILRYTGSRSLGDLIADVLSRLSAALNRLKNGTIHPLSRPSLSLG